MFGNIRVMLYTKNKNQSCTTIAPQFFETWCILREVYTEMQDTMYELDIQVYNY